MNGTKTEYFVVLRPEGSSTHIAMKIPDSEIDKIMDAPSIVIDIERLDVSRESILATPREVKRK